MKKGKKTVTILIIVSTLILAGIAIFTAIRLYQLRQEAVAPTVPESRPAAATETLSCQDVTFTLATPSPSPSPSGTPGPTASPSASPGPTATPSSPATPAPAMPVSGIGTPTIIGLSGGLLLVIISIILAF